MPQRLLVVDDHKCIRDMVRLSCQINGGNEFIIVGEAWNAATALELCQQVRPDIVLLDIFLRHENGLAVGEQIRSLIPETKIIFFTCADEVAFIREALRIGAAGYLLKTDTDANTLPNIIMKISKGNIVFPQGKLYCAIENEELSAEQITALSLKAYGHTTKEIAARLNKSEKGIEKIFSAAYEKLGVRNVAQAIYVLTKRGAI